MPKKILILFFFLIRKASDPLTWHVVPSQNSLPFTQDESQTSRDVRILLNVAPHTKLGCG